MSPARRILVLAALLPVLILAAVAAAALLIPQERVAAVVAQRAEAVLGERVRIGGVGLRFLPLPGVRLTDVAVGGQSDSTAIAVLDAAELRARLLPLLRGQVILDRVELVRPRILLEVDSAGQLNLPLSRGDASAPDTADRSIRFEIDRIDVSDGRIGYRDLRDDVVVRLDGWDQRLRLAGNVEAGELAQVVLEGTLSFADVDARLPEVVVPVRDVALHVVHDATLDRGIDRLDLRALTVALDGIALEGSGTMDSVSSATGRSLALALDARGLDVGELVQWVPDSVRARLDLPDGRPVEVDGIFGLSLRLDGPLAADAMPRVDGTFDLTGGAIGLDGEALLEEVRGEGVLAVDSLVFRLNGRFLGEPFTAGVAVREPASPTAVMAFNGRGDLARLVALGFVSDTLGLDGAVRADVQARLPLRDLASAQAGGTIDLHGVRLTGTDMALGVPTATIELQGERVRVEPLPLRLGPNDVPVTLDIAAERWIPALFDSTAPPPRVVAAVQADSLDLDALLGPSESQYPPLLFARLRERTLDGRTAAEVAEAAGLGLPSLPDLDADITFVIGRLVRNDLIYRDLDAGVRIRPGVAELEYARFLFMDGAVQLSGRMEIVDTDSAGASTSARVLGEYTLAGVQAARFFDRLTPFRDHLAGELGLAGSFGFLLDRHALPDRSATTASGTIALADGRVANWRVLQALVARLGLTAIDTLRFQDWVGRFDVTGSLVTLDETALDGRDIDVSAAGSFDLGGTLDLGATVYLSRELAARAGEIGDRAMALAADDGRIPVGVTITGAADNPDVGIDLSEARANVVARARDAARAEAAALAQRTAGQVADHFEIPDSLRGLSTDSLRAVLGDSLYALVPDSLKITRDSVRTRAEEELRERVLQILPGRRRADPDTSGGGDPDTVGAGGGRKP